VIGGFTTKPRTDHFNPNPIYTYSAVNEQYPPLGYGNVPPEIAVVSPENKTYTSSSISLVFTVDKSAVWMGYSLDGQETVTVTGNTTLNALSNGLHNITVYAGNEFENTAASETISFTVYAPQPFPITLVIAPIASVAAIGVGLLAYFKKRNK
jgi:hypothetical protein